MFRKDSEYTRKEIHRQIGGGIQSCFLRHNGGVVGICFVPSKNPRAPSSIYVGRGSSKERAAEILASSRIVVPVFSKQEPNAWKHVGNFRAIAYSQNTSEVGSARAESGRKDIVGILHLSRVK